MNDLKDRIKNLIVERLFLDVAPESIGDSDNLMETLGVDSVALFELVVGLEDEFGISLEDADFQIDSFRSVNSIAEFVESKGGAA
jgi:acyl carrier protein